MFYNFGDKAVCLLKHEMMTLSYLSNCLKQLNNLISIEYRILNNSTELNWYVILDSGQFITS